MESPESASNKGIKKQGENNKPEDIDEEESFLECCQKTIDMHAANNPMMVCSDCKQIIKCFSDERAYKNYQRFCASRHRRILATSYNSSYVVVFRSYDTYST